MPLTWNQRDLQWSGLPLPSSDPSQNPSRKLRCLIPRPISRTTWLVSQLVTSRAAARNWYRSQ
eukprot:2342430-Rhodomonas_salina.3